MKTGPLKPVVAFCAARRRSSRFPAFSKFSRFTGIEARRLVSWRGSQKLSVSFTSVKGTGWSFRSVESARAAANAANRTNATNGRMRLLRLHAQNSERVRWERVLDDTGGNFHSRGLGRNSLRLVNRVLVGRVGGGQHGGSCLAGNLLCAVEGEFHVSRLARGVDDFHDHVAVFVAGGTGVEAADAGGRALDVVHEFAIKPALDSVAGQGHFDVIPASGFNRAAFWVHRAVQFNGVLAVVPAGDVPPVAVFAVEDMEQDQKTLATGNLPCLEFERVIGPRLVAGQRADELAFRRLPQRAVFRAPFCAVAKQRP